jgi:hypothetical protein
MHEQAEFFQQLKPAERDFYHGLSSGLRLVVVCGSSGQANLDPSARSAPAALINTSRRKWQHP